MYCAVAVEECGKSVIQNMLKQKKKNTTMDREIDECLYKEIRKDLIFTIRHSGVGYRKCSLEHCIHSSGFANRKMVLGHRITKLTSCS